MKKILIIAFFVFLQTLVPACLKRPPADSTDHDKEFSKMPHMLRPEFVAFAEKSYRIPPPTGQALFARRATAIIITCDKRK